MSGRSSRRKSKIGSSVQEQVQPVDVYFNNEYGVVEMHRPRCIHGVDLAPKAFTLIDHRLVSDTVAYTRVLRLNMPGKHFFIEDCLA